jgi:hypothetical protein
MILQGQKNSADLWTAKSVEKGDLERNGFAAGLLARCTTEEVRMEAAASPETRGGSGMHNMSHGVSLCFAGFLILLGGAQAHVPAVMGTTAGELSLVIALPRIDKTTVFLVGLVGLLVLFFCVGFVVGRFYQGLQQRRSVATVAVQAETDPIRLEDLTMNAIRERLSRHRRSTAGAKFELADRLRLDEPWWQ